MICKDKIVKIIESKIKNKKTSILKHKSVFCSLMLTVKDLGKGSLRVGQVCTKIPGGEMRSMLLTILVPRKGVLYFEFYCIFINKFIENLTWGSYVTPRPPPPCEPLIQLFIIVRKNVWVSPIAKKVFSTDCAKRDHL